jgi:hypothetical protein
MPTQRDADMPTLRVAEQAKRKPLRHGGWFTNPDVNEFVSAARQPQQADYVSQLPPHPEAPALPVMAARQAH